MTKRTPEQEIAHQRQKMKDLGVTVSIKFASGVQTTGARPFQVIAEAARAAGIYEGGAKDDAPPLSVEERAEVERFGIHPELEGGV